MTIEHGNYRSCLGTAAEVDRTEQAYALLHTNEGSGEIGLTACVPDPKIFLAFVEALTTQLGAYVSKQMAALPADGLTTEERNLVIGTTTAFVATLAVLTPEAKTMLCKIASEAIKELGESSLEEAVAKVRDHLTGVLKC